MNQLQKQTEKKTLSIIVYVNINPHINMDIKLGFFFPYRINLVKLELCFLNSLPCVTSVEGWQKEICMSFGKRKQPLCSECLYGPRHPGKSRIFSLCSSCSCPASPAALQGLSQMPCMVCGKGYWLPQRVTHVVKVLCLRKAISFPFPKNLYWPSVWNLLA